jgi:hypothetical protein
MIRIIAKLFAVAVALFAFSPVAPLFAADVVYLSSTGNDAGPCTAAAPCATIASSLGELSGGGQISCINSPGAISLPIVEVGNSLTIDCVGVWETNENSVVFTLGGTQTVKIRNVTMSGSPGGLSAIKVTGGGTLILENCIFENFDASGAGPALDIEPSGPLSLVITNSRISNNAAGVVIQPGSGGSVTATFDGVTIADNTGGGLKTDTINGGINLAISNSTISKNGGNGVNAVGGAGGQNVLQLTHDVIAYNSVAGVQANGASAAVLVNNTSILNNATGATSLIANGRILTYGNNSIVGLPGSGFTGPASLQ